jgi:hypothetical protein
MGKEFSQESFTLDNITLFFLLIGLNENDIKGRILATFVKCVIYW